MQDISQKANIVRALSIISTTEAGSGHPTSCMSAADLTTLLFDKYFRYDIKNPKYENNDRFLISKGHVAPLYYTLFSLSGAISREKLLTLRKFDSVLEGHPTPLWEYADAATGSLGQGLSIGAGIALHAKRNSLSHKTIVLLGDGELAEGQVWEACNFAAQEKLNNLIAIADINGLGQTGRTMFFHDMDAYHNRFKSFGWETVVVDGHNFEQIDKALKLSYENDSEKPIAVIAKTHKGKGVDSLDEAENFHGKPVPEEDLEKALQELGVAKDVVKDSKTLFDVKIPDQVETKNADQTKEDSLTYKVGEEHATREVFGEALVALGKSNSSVYAIDGDVGNSTYTLPFKDSHPDRFVQGYIAEQNMVSVGVGLSSMGMTPYVASFGAFLSRAYDQVRMAAISRANIKLVGSHAGVSIGEDGPSQMALEDIAFFTSIPSTVVLHPSDANSTAKLTFKLSQHKGISYLRTLRPKTPVLYDSNEEFSIGGSKTLISSKDSDLVVIAAGITVHEALAAAKELKKEGINICLIDAYSVKPLDKDSIVKAVNESKSKKIITVEDHFFHGGLGDMVAQAVSEQRIPVKKLAVKRISHSGPKDKLLEEAEIDSKAIINTTKSLLK